jgi:imidazolonepropionase-like amidohydrolase
MNRALLLPVFLILTVAGLQGAEGDGLFVVKASRVYVGDGTVIEEGGVVIKDGRIVMVAPLADLPECDGYITNPDGVITAGLIDASSTAGLINKSTWTEHSSEVVPRLAVIDMIDFRSRDFERLARAGVTSVYVTPGSGSVVGSRGCVVKTAGPRSQRVLLAKSSVKATMGRDSYRRGASNRRPFGRQVTFMARRPTTRMGSTQVFRESFYKAGLYRDGRAAGGDAMPAFDADMDLLADVLEGKIPFRVQARKDVDIWAAIRLCGEFGIDFVLEEAIEAHRCLPELKKLGAPVVYGPIFTYPRGWRAFTGEANRPCLSTAALLKKAGVPVAITAGDQTGEGVLPRQAGHAVRAGLSFTDALDCVTTTPARILGVDDRVGIVKAGLDADLVLWNGNPFDVAARPLAVIVSGQTIHIEGLSAAETKTINKLGAGDGTEEAFSTSGYRAEGTK